VGVGGSTIISIRYYWHGTEHAEVFVVTTYELRQLPNITAHKIGKFEISGQILAALISTSP
jgi:hypothetical protein